MISTPTWPASWNARMRCSGIARPMWMSGEVTSMPSFSFASSPPAGRTSTALRVSSPLIPAATLAGVLARLRRTARAPKRRRIRKLRLLGLLFVLGLLGLAAFTFGALKAVSAQVGSLDPYRQQQREQSNTYVYAGDGHTILEIL